MAPELRFWPKVNKNGPIPANRPDLGPCWIWLIRTSKSGYGLFNVLRKNCLAHRFSFELLKEKIPKNMTIDHLCRVRNCVNPDHMEVVTLKENILRGNTRGAMNAVKTHCPQGHPLSGENVKIEHRGNGEMRRCLTCRRELDHKRGWRRPSQYRNLDAAILP
jgi:hypothetical protein